MTSKLAPEQIKEKILTSLHFIAPEIDLTKINPEVALRDQIDIDSLDFVRLVIKWHETFGVDVPESDYAKLSTLNNCINYFNEKS